MTPDQVAEAEAQAILAAQAKRAEVLDRFTFHPNTSPAVGALHDAYRGMFRDVAAQIDQLPDSREKALALTALEETMHWTSALIARRQLTLGGHEEPVDIGGTDLDREIDQHPDQSPEAVAERTGLEIVR